MYIPESAGFLLFAGLILWGAGIWLVFVLQRMGLPFLVKSQNSLRKYRHRIQIAEFIVWLIYLSWFIFRFLDTGNIFAVVPIIFLLGLLYLVFRNWLSEIVSGLILRNTRQINIGDHIELNDISGIIKSIDKTSVQLENRDGKITYIPFSQLINKTFTKIESTKQSTGRTIEINVKKTADIEQTMERIKEEIMALPWSSVHVFPKIEVTGQTSENYMLKVTYFAIESSYAGEIESHLERTFG